MLMGWVNSLLFLQWFLAVLPRRHLLGRQSIFVPCWWSCGCASPKPAMAQGNSDLTPNCVLWQAVELPYIQLSWNWIWAGRRSEAAVLTLPSHGKGLLTALSFSDQVMPQGMSPSVLPLSHAGTSHSSQGKEMGHILLGAGCLPTSEIQIDGTEGVFSHSQNLKLKVVKKHGEDWDSPQWPLCTAVAHTRAVICPWPPREEYLWQGFGKTVHCILKLCFLPPQHDRWRKVCPQMHGKTLPDDADAEHPSSSRTLYCARQWADV